MEIEDIKIIAGRPDFDFTPIRKLEVKCEASNALMPAPTVTEANGRLRALAAKVGADAIIEVEYNSGVSFTSWKSLKATGLAVSRISDETTCPTCAETIKIAATKCRYCGADRTEIVAELAATREASVTTVGSTSATRRPVPDQVPLKDNNNPAIIIGIILAVLVVIGIIAGAA